jgi:hypothetical protein
VAVGTVYLYFQNINDSLVDVCLTLKAEVAQVIQSFEILALPPEQLPHFVIAATFRMSRKGMRFMNSFQVEGQSLGEVARLQGAQDEVLGSLNAYFRGLIAQGKLPPFATAAWAGLLNHLVSATVHQCFAVEQGARRGLPRGRHRFHRRVFFCPPLAAGGGVSSTPQKEPHRLCRRSIFVFVSAYR